MSKFKKFCPNVWLAECTEAHAKGDIIQVENRFGVEVDCEVHNLIRQADGKWFYSIVRTDAPWAKRKAERYRASAESNAAKSAERWNAAQEGRDFLSMGEPIKVGHHSEKRHRALFERNWGRMGKSVEYDDKAKKAAELAEYWEGRAEEITLAMPESLEHFTAELAKAKAYHAGLKDGTIAKEHSYSLTYAKKRVNELGKKVELAEKLWGSYE